MKNEEEEEKSVSAALAWQFGTKQVLTVRTPAIDCATSAAKSLASGGPSKSRVAITGKWIGENEQKKKENRRNKDRKNEGNHGGKKEGNKETKKGIKREKEKEEKERKEMNE